MSEEKPAEEPKKPSKWEIELDKALHNPTKETSFSDEVKIKPEIKEIKWW